jgi:acetylornithine/N-succinyldiaminopimelate aminotransferase
MHGAARRGGTFHFAALHLKRTSTTVTSHLLPTYARADVAFERGEGAWLFSTTGERYLDCSGGVAVNVLGHAHPRLLEALTAQAHKVWHVSNLYRVPEAERLADRLCAVSFADLVFFCNSGAEAMECCIKAARKHHAAAGHPERHRIITFEGAFHGRTLATLAAGGNKKYLDGFGPVAEGFDHIAFGDIDVVKRAITPETAAILIEPIQGEGGVRVVPNSFLQSLRALCDQHGLMLIFDEVQTGVGRTGYFFAYERTGVKPDILGLAKGLGGGFPVGACLATADAGKGMTTGTHGSTFGGNPMAMAIGNGVLDVLLAPGFLEDVRKKALLFKQRLAEIHDRHSDVIAEVRGDGLLLGLRTTVPNGELVDALRAEHLLAVAAGDNVVRLLPALIISDSEIGEAIDRIDRAATSIERSLAAKRKLSGATV